MLQRPYRLAFSLATATAILAWNAGPAGAYLPDPADPSHATPITIGPGNTPDYLTTQNWAFSPCPGASSPA
ncbi:MAG: hypothetical protein AB1568_16175 [Thermodesulfobacteriota bacterium]